MPKISVIIPAYNQAHFLGAAVESVLSQSMPDFELIIVNDGSTDQTEQVVLSYQDSRITYVSQQNRGLSGARNTGIRQASGDYLTYLDSDDAFFPQKLAVLSKALENPEIGFAAGQALPIDEHGQPIGKLFDKGLPDPIDHMLLGNPRHVGSVLLRRSWQERAGFFDESLRSYEDWDMWLRLIRLGCRMEWVPSPVSLYRFHTAQMTRIGKQMTTATFNVLDKIYAEPDLPASWLALKDHAYSQAYLRAAAQAYHARDFATGKAHLQKALELHPALADDGAQSLVAQFSGWTELPKTLHPFQFLADIYNNLPPELDSLSLHKEKILCSYALEKGFQAYQDGQLPQARGYMLQALRRKPSLVLNRGVISILRQIISAKNVPINHQEKS